MWEFFSNCPTQCKQHCARNNFKGWWRTYGNRRVSAQGLLFHSCHVLIHTPGPSLCKSTQIKNNHNGLICQIMISKTTSHEHVAPQAVQTRSNKHLLQLQEQLFCNTQHNKPKKSAPLQHIFLLPYISRTQKMLLHLRQWHHIKYSPYFFREFMTFGEARMMTTTGNRHSSEAT